MRLRFRCPYWDLSVVVVGCLSGQGGLKVTQASKDGWSVSENGVDVVDADMILLDIGRGRRYELVVN